MKFMKSKKRWVISGAAALLLVAAGVTIFAIDGQTPTAPAPIPSSQKVEALEEKFGTAPAMPSSEDLKKQLVEVEAKIQAAAPTAAPPAGPAPGAATADSDWMEAELLKQQIVFAERAPTSIPTAHSKVVMTGTPPPVEK